MRAHLTIEDEFSIEIDLDGLPYVAPHAPASRWIVSVNVRDTEIQSMTLADGTIVQFADFTQSTFEMRIREGGPEAREIIESEGTPGGVLRRIRERFVG